jgi:hypothetical protein
LELTPESGWFTSWASSQLSQRYYANHVGQLSHCPLQFGRPFHHLHLKFIACFANFFLSPAPFMNQVRAAEGCRCMIRSHCEQHPVHSRRSRQSRKCERFCTLSYQLFLTRGKRHQRVLIPTSAS